MRQLLSLRRRLEHLARDLGVVVRYEPLQIKDSSGNLCEIQGKKYIVCDARAPTIDQIYVLAEAVARLHVILIDIPPIMRRRIMRVLRDERLLMLRINGLSGRTFVS